MVPSANFPAGTLAFWRLPAHEPRLRAAVLAVNYLLWKSARRSRSVSRSSRAVQADRPAIRDRRHADRGRSPPGRPHHRCRLPLSGRDARGLDEPLQLPQRASRGPHDARSVLECLTPGFWSGSRASCGAPSAQTRDTRWHVIRSSQGLLASMCSSQSYTTHARGPRRRPSTVLSAAMSARESASRSRIKAILTRSATASTQCRKGFATGARLQSATTPLSLQ